MNDHLTFDLVEAPWLPVIFVDGTPSAVGIRELIVRAAEIRVIATDVPTQIPPIVRMLLAVLHRALADDDGLAGPRSTDEWLALWKAGRFPQEKITAYLDRWRDRFDLFHSTAPFMQAADLRTRKEDARSVASLISYATSGNNTPLFSAERDAKPRAIDAAAAARWLLHVHAYDTAGIKTGAVGDPAAKSTGKTTGNRVGPLGELGVVMPLGDNLWQTLMLNLLVLGDTLSGERDIPVWERDRPLGAEWSAQEISRGLCDLYVWPSRRVRLFPEVGPDGQVVVRHVLICAGDRMATPVGPRREPHTAWRLRAAPKNKTGVAGEYGPITHRPGRQLWRGLGPILADAQAGGDRAGFRKPYVLDQLGAHDRRSVLRQEVVRLLGVGIRYGQKSSSIDETYADTTPMPVAVLEDPDWQEAVVSAVEATDDAVRALGHLAVNLARAAGSSDKKLEDGVRDRFERRGYASVDQLFRDWLERLMPDEDPDAAVLVWFDQARRAISDLADERLRTVSPAAIRGRRVLINKERVDVNAAIAEIWFRAHLSRALPYPDNPPDSAGPGDEGAAA